MTRLDRLQRTRSDRRDEIRQRLVRALEELLEEEGVSFASVKVEDLAARAGISRANFYIHFQDKVELLERWLRETRTTLFEVSSDWYDAPPSLTVDELRRVIGSIFRAYRDRLTLMAAMHETALYDATLRDDFAKAFEMHFSALTTHIEAGQRSGDIRVDILARETAEWLVCMMERAPTRVPRTASRNELNRLADSATAVIWATLYGPAPNRTR